MHCDNYQGLTLNDSNVILVYCFGWFLMIIYLPDATLRLPPDFVVRTGLWTQSGQDAVSIAQQREKFLLGHLHHNNAAHDLSNATK